MHRRGGASPSERRLISCSLPPARSLSRRPLSLGSLLGRCPLALSFLLSFSLALGLSTPSTTPRLLFQRRTHQGLQTQLCLVSVTSAIITPWPLFSLVEIVLIISFTQWVCGGDHSTVVTLRGVFKGSYPRIFSAVTFKGIHTYNL